MTDSGKIFLKYGEKIENLLQEMNGEIDSLKEEKAQEISIAMTLNSVFLSFSNFSEKIKIKYPNLKIEFSSLFSYSIIENLKNKRFNFAIGPYLEDENISLEELYEEYFLLVISKKWNFSSVSRNRDCPYPWIDISKLSDMPFILQDRTCYIRKEIDELFKEYNNLELKNKIIVGNSVLAIHAVENQLGCCFISEGYLKYLNNNNNLNLYCVGKNIKKSKTHLIYLKNKKFTVQEKYCLNLLKTFFNNYIK